MEIQRAKELLTILADGVNPITGEVLPDADQRLCQMFDARVEHKEMCTYFKRTSGAITSRLARLGKLG